MNGFLKSSASFAGAVFASILLSFSYSEVSVAEEAKDSCTTKNFSKFLLEFSSNQEMQKRLVLDGVKVMTLKQKGESEQVEPFYSLMKFPELRFPLIAPIGDFKEKGIEVVKVDKETYHVIDKREGDGGIKTYAFKMNSCWELSEVEDWAITPVNFNPPQKKGMSEGESFLFQKAMAYSWLGWAQKYELTSELFQASLDNFLLAATNGNPEASLAAAGLSYSGMAPKLESDKLESLYKAAAETLPAGAEGLSYVYCYGNDLAGSGLCKNPILAEQAIIRSAKLGSAEGANTVGEYFETGKLVTNDISRAIACYQLAAKKGNSDAVKNLERLKQRKAYMPQASYCY